MQMARYLVEAHLLEGRSVAELANAHGVHRSWIYKLLARYSAEGDAGLRARSRRPRRSPTRVCERHVKEIVALREQLAAAGFDAGPQTIHAHLQRQHQDIPSVSTIWRVLKREGFITAQPHKRPYSSVIRFEAQLPNEMWQADVTAWALASGEVVEILDLIDDHSRLLLGSDAYGRVKAPDVVSSFHRAADLHGLPASLLSDNGAAFVGGYRAARSSWSTSSSASAWRSRTRGHTTPRRAGRSNACTKRSSAIWLSKTQLRRSRSCRASSTPFATTTTTCARIGRLADTRRFRPTAPS
jgi:transposase